MASLLTIYSFFYSKVLLQRRQLVGYTDELWSGAMPILKCLALVATLCVTGCTVPLNKVVSSSERTVLVQALSRDMTAAQKLADAECAKPGRHARLTAYDDRSVVHVYDCIG